MRRKRLSLGLLVFVLALTLSAFPPAAATTNGVVVQTEAELLAAIDNRAANIVIDGLIPLSRSIVIDHHVTLGGQGTLMVADGNWHFRIRAGGHLVLDGDITLTRGAGYTGNGGGVLVDGGVFTLYAGQISGNRAERGGGILIWDGHVNLNGGTISQNHAELGGGIYIGGPTSSGDNRAVTLTMGGGLIAENTADFSGGGIFSYMTTLRLMRGTIRDNQAAGHGGVYTCTTTILQTGPGMRIEGNSPHNRHDAPERSWFARLQTLSAVHVLLLFAIGGIGIGLQKRSNDRKRRALLAAQGKSEYL